MRGYYEFNFPAFEEATAKLRAEGHEVFNPAERDIAVNGYPAGMKGTMEELADMEFDLRAAIADDLNFICREADAIYFLPGWYNSTGACLEFVAAKFCRIEVLNTQPLDFVKALATAAERFFAAS